MRSGPEVLTLKDVGPEYDEAAEPGRLYHEQWPTSGANLFMATSLS